MDGVVAIVLAGALVALWAGSLVALLLRARGFPRVRLSRRWLGLLRGSNRVAAALPLIALVLFSVLVVRLRVGTGAWPVPRAFDFAAGRSIGPLPDPDAVLMHALTVLWLGLAAFWTIVVYPATHCALAAAGAGPGWHRLVRWAASYVALLLVLWMDPFRGVSWLTSS